MCLIHPKTGASGSPVFPGHVRDPLRCFSRRARQELRFEWCWSDVGPTVPEICPFSWKLLFFGRMSKFDSGALPVFVFVFVCANLYSYLCICICICVFVFVFVYLYLYLITTTFCFGSFLMKIHSWLLRLALHDNLGVFKGHGSFLGNWASETLSEGIPVQLFDSPPYSPCRWGLKWTNNSLFCLGHFLAPDPKWAYFYESVPP